MKQGDQHSLFEIELISQQLICPLTQFLLTDPVMIQTGHTFDRQMIQGWFLRGNKTNPVTGLPLKSLKLYPNILVRNIIKKLPIVEKKIRNKAKQIQGLLQTLEEMWNNQTPLGVSEIKNQNKKLQKQNETLKAELMHKQQQKLLQKMELQVTISSKDEKIEALEKSNKHLKGLIKRETDLRRVRDEQIYQLEKQLARTTLQAKQGLPPVQNKAYREDFSTVLPIKENKSCEHEARKSPRQGKYVEKIFKQIPHFLKQSAFSQQQTRNKKLRNTKTDRQQKTINMNNGQEQENEKNLDNFNLPIDMVGLMGSKEIEKKEMKNSIYTGKNIPRPPLSKTGQKLVKQMSKEQNKIKRERQSLKSNKVMFI